MSKEIIYWTTKKGTKIDIDKMSIGHLRHALKMIVKQNQNTQKKDPNSVKDVVPFSDKEIKAITNKSSYQLENEENLWK